MAPRLQQVQLGLGPGNFQPIETYKRQSKAYVEEHTRHQASLLRLCPAHAWYHGSFRQDCPRPILISEYHQTLLNNLHESLNAALTDIVQRWWTDREARLPERMPLEETEEDLLRANAQASCGNVRRFSACLGSWRPDFLVEDIWSDQKGTTVENFRVTEINARFPFNGLMHEAFNQRALDDLGVGVNGLMHATEPEKVLNGVFGLFEENMPLHLLKGEERGIDIHMFIHSYQRRFGVSPRLIEASDLRLLPNSESQGRYRLYCVAKVVGNQDGLYSASPRLIHQGEVLEEVHQIGLELHQHELRALAPEMRREISVRCFNDLRTILLVHDKRILGIIKQELPTLVAREVLTADQAATLDKGIVDTILPGSPEIDQLLRELKENPDLKNSYLLKPIRDGKGAGIVFGDELGSSDWTSALEPLRSSGLGGFVLQRRIFPRLYELILKESGERVNYPLVGTYHAIDATLIGLGIWRSSPGRICALSSGGSSLCTVIQN
ncbi:hypothetical protein GQ53DRAFT_659813 [Thozetella sp. PMI_491]|nr:hypothetical protein GQ53DRAFT_659813 [Thozetella sp. PMI_491]